MLEVYDKLHLQKLMHLKLLFSKCMMFLFKTKSCYNLVIKKVLVYSRSFTTCFNTKVKFVWK